MTLRNAGSKESRWNNFLHSCLPRRCRRSCPGHGPKCRDRELVNSWIYDLAPLRNPGIQPESASEACDARDVCDRNRSSTERTEHTEVSSTEAPPRLAKRVRVRLRHG